MNRTQERKTAFELIFTFPFNKELNCDELLDNYILYNDFSELSEYVRNTVKGCAAHIDDIDSKIRNNIRHRKFERLDNVCLAAMRLAVYEMFYNGDIPVNVAINEAIELTKIYDDSLSAFVHANLGIIAKLENE